MRCAGMSHRMSRWEDSYRSGVSLLVCLGLWLLQNIGRLIPDLHLPFPIPDMTAAVARPWLWLLTFLLIAAALWLGRSEEHWLRKQA